MHLINGKSVLTSGNYTSGPLIAAGSSWECIGAPDTKPWYGRRFARLPCRAGQSKGSFMLRRGGFFPLISTSRLFYSPYIYFKSKFHFCQSSQIIVCQ